LILGGTGVEIEIFDLVSKVTSFASNSPDTDWTNGLVDMRIDAGVTAITFPYCVPTSSKNFNIGWNIVKRTKVELGMGRSHEHVFNFSPNRMIDTQYAEEYNNIRGVTYQCMVIVRGLLADDTPAFGPSANVSFTRAKVIYVSRAKFISRCVAVKPRNYVQVNTVPISLATTNVQNEASGAATGITYG
jgi:hypothetical protein